jgi:low temperature requirement protein LtrA
MDNDMENGESSVPRRAIGLHIWWQRPRLRTDEDEDKERRATWLELFYDLIFVAVIAQLSHKLSADISLNAILGYAFLFVPVWLLWLSSTYYNERFEVYDVRHRVFTFIKMIPIAGLACSIHGAFEETSVAFAVSYIAARVILIYMWLIAGRRQDSMTRKTTERFVIGSSISVLLWIVSLFLHGELRFVLWGVALLIEMITPFTTVKIQTKMVRISVSHISERFGLFTIIAIAETVIGVVNGVAKLHHITFHSGLAGGLGLTFAFSIWWVYFDHVIYRPFRQNTWVISLWSYLHLPTTIGITAIGAGMVNIVAHEGEAAGAPLRWMLCGAVSLVLLIMGILGSLNERHDHSKNVRFDENLNLQLLIPKVIAAIIVLAVGLFGRSLNSLLLLSILVLSMVSQAVQGLYIWVKAQLET